MIKEKQFIPDSIEKSAEPIKRTDDCDPVVVIEGAADLLRNFDQGISGIDHEKSGDFFKKMKNFSDRIRTQFRNLVMGIIVSGLINIGPGAANAAVFSDGVLASDRKVESKGVTDYLKQTYEAGSKFSHDIRAALEGAKIFLEMGYYAKTRNNGVMSEEELEFRERIAQNVENFGYSGDIENPSALFPSVLSRIDQFSNNKKTYSKERTETSDLKMRIRVDMFRKYLGLKPFGDFLKKSEYVPGRSKDANASYYSFDKKALLEDIKTNWNNSGNIRKFDDFVAYAGIGTREHFPHMKKLGGNYLPHLGTFNMEVGYDEEREEQYISYYDKWDLTPPDLEKYDIDLDSLNFPFEIYDRIYESDLKKIK